jgi:hypothetical protein
VSEPKNRGHQTDRIAHGLARAVESAAPVIKCNTCGSVLPRSARMDVQGLKGIEIAYKAHCTACEQDTWAVRGQSASVRAFYEALEKTSGKQVQLGTSRPASND